MKLNYFLFLAAKKARGRKKRSQRHSGVEKIVLVLSLRREARKRHNRVIVTSSWSINEAGGERWPSARKIFVFCVTCDGGTKSSSRTAFERTGGVFRSASFCVLENFATLTDFSWGSFSLASQLGTSLNIAAERNLDDWKRFVIKSLGTLFKDGALSQQQKVLVELEQLATWFVFA